MLGQQHPLAERIGRGVFIPERRSSASFTPPPPEHAAGICYRTEVCSSLISDPAKMTGWSGSAWEPGG